MPTPLQLRLIHIASRQIGLDEEQYRMVLLNAGGVSSSKNLTQAGYEDVMAVFEDTGFRQSGQPANYWRMKVATRGWLCGERMVHRIRELAAKQHYDLGGLCQRFSDGKVFQIERLSPRQAANLIQMLNCFTEVRLGFGYGRGCLQRIYWRVVIESPVTLWNLTRGKPSCLQPSAVFLRRN